MSGLRSGTQLTGKGIGLLMGCLAFDGVPGLWCDAVISWNGMTWQAFARPTGMACGLLVQQQASGRWLSPPMGYMAY